MCLCQHRRHEFMKSQCRERPFLFFFSFILHTLHDWSHSSSLQYESLESSRTSSRCEGSLFTSCGLTCLDMKILRCVLCSCGTELSCHDWDSVCLDHDRKHVLFYRHSEPGDRKQVECLNMFTLVLLTRQTSHLCHSQRVKH